MTAFYSNTGVAQETIGWLQGSRRAGKPLVEAAALPLADHAPAVSELGRPLSATSSTCLAAAVRLVSCFAAAHMVLQLHLGHRLASPILLLTGFVFTVYVGALYWGKVRDAAFQEHKVTYWLDTLWYLAFVGMTGGLDSRFTLFLPFPVLFVSRRWGFSPGIKLACFSATILFFIGLGSTRPGTLPLGSDIVLPPVALFMIGYAIASWANSDLALDRQLATLRAIDASFNPRLNIEQIFDKVVRQLGALYQVRSYALILTEAGHATRLYRATLPGGIVRVSDCTGLRNVVSAMAMKNHTAVYCGARGLRGRNIHGYTATSAAALKTYVRDAAAVANQLTCNSFSAIECELRQGGRARLFICSDEYRFGPADLPFFRQLAKQLSPQIENVQLLDLLAREVIEGERQRISRDIHDSAIQPYIGLKFALEALDRKVPPGNPLSKDIVRLVEMANMEIAELRRYVKGLRSPEKTGYAELASIVRRQALRFGELYAIGVNVEATGEFRVDDALADEVFHIVSEALSNIRRHTSASVAWINLSCDGHKLALQVVNPRDAGLSLKGFTPRSISERALALGGTCHVETVPGRGTAVIVEIPLASRMN